MATGPGTHGVNVDGGLVRPGRILLVRSAQLAATVAGVLVASFLLIHLAPGDPVLALAGEHGDAGYYDDMRARFALDRPLPEQLLAFGQRVLSGDLGNSWVQGRPARSVIAERIPATLLLTGTALMISTLLGLALGSVAAMRRGSRMDLSINVATLVLFSVPVFLLGQLALLAFALFLPWFPVFGMVSPTVDGSGLSGLIDRLRHLALPALVLAVPQLADVARLTRSALLTELGQLYVRTARGTGLGPLGVLRHALRLSLLPVVTLVGSRIGHLLGGAVIVESIFGWPGLGTLMLTATGNRDAPVLLGIFFLVTLTVVLANLLTDLTYGWLDPRVSARDRSRVGDLAGGGGTPARVTTGVGPT